MQIKPLPDYCIPGRELVDVDGVVVHYFSARNVDREQMFDLQACYNLFLDLNRRRVEREHYMLNAGHWPERRMYASAHYLIGRDGTSWQLVDPGLQAWHAGKSLLDGREDLNRWTIGIELVGHGQSQFTHWQYMHLAQLLAELQARYGFPRENVVGHDLVRWNWLEAHDFIGKRKYDPSGAPDGQGDNFNWQELHQTWEGLPSTAAPSVPAAVVDPNRPSG